MVSIANKERQNESSSPVSVFHLMNSPPVLHKNAAAKTKSRGELRIFTGFCSQISADFSNISRRHHSTVGSRSTRSPEAEPGRQGESMALLRQYRCSQTP